jgi:cobalt-zinc-cadmium efflux system outer membrane protein
MVATASAAPATAWCTTAPPTLDQVLAIALRDNPDAREARLRLDEARADQRAARAIPNPSFTVAPANPYQYLWSVPADVGPQRLYRTRAARLNTEAASSDLADQRQQTTLAVRQAFFDVLLADSLLTLAFEEEGIVRQLVSADSLRVRAGDLSETELARSAVELVQVEAARTRAQASLHQARLTLQSLMGVAYPDTGFTVSGDLRFRPLDLPLDSLEQVAMRNRPDLVAAERRTEQARALQSGARAGLIPTPSLALVHQPGGPFESGSYYALGLSITVPLFDWGGASRQRAAAQLATDKAEEVRVQAQIASSVATAIDDHLTSRTLASRYAGGVLERARAALESVRYGYSRGSRSLLDFLDALRSYGQTRADYFNAVRDYWVSAYALSRAAGKELIP